MLTIAILWPVKAIFEKRAATVEVDTFLSPENYAKSGQITINWAKFLYRSSSFQRIEQALWQKYLGFYRKACFCAGRCMFLGERLEKTLILQIILCAHSA